MSKETVWVVDDDRSIRWVLEKAFKQADMEVKSYEQADSVLKALNKAQPDAIISDIRMPGMDGLELLSRIHSRFPELPVIIITAHTDLDAAVSAYQGGAFEYLPKPFDVDEAVELTRRAVKHHRELSNEQRVDLEEETEIIGEAPSMQEVFRAIGRLSRSNITVLINGESGTGKELVAHALHRHSPRAEMPFIALNMAAIPRDLLESELFGHEKGAFTDAKSAKQGLVEIANGGTLFLDEIGELSLALQPKLLRFLENGEYRRIGGITNLTSNVRVIGATNKNLLEESEQKSFRKDLLFRLNVITLTIPPLRERKEDIILLANYFLKKKSPVRTPKKLSPEAEELLLSYSFNGNIRELDHIIERAIIFADGEYISPDDLNLPHVFQKGIVNPASGDNDEIEEILSMEELERWHIQKVLNKNHWDRTRTATQLGISPKTLYTKIKKYELRPISF